MTLLERQNPREKQKLVIELVLPLILAERKEAQALAREETERVKELQRDRMTNEKREEPGSKTAQTFMILCPGELFIEIQGYGKVPVTPPVQYVNGASTRTYGVPTNYNSIVAPGTGMLGYVVPYKTDEFDKAA